MQTQTAIFAPANEAEAAEFLRDCAGNARSVRFTGGTTKLDMGNAYVPTPATLSTLKLDALVDYQPEDLTITVGAGITFAKLQSILAEQGQKLALDPPDLTGQTIGGVLATNRSGPRRLLYGTARDLLIGCRFVLADGTLAHSGGRVVKNVAGYDLHKLFIGAFGTLGLLTEVTFKVTPLPQMTGVSLARFATPATAFEAARQCARSNLMPALLEIVTSSTTDDAILYYGAEGVSIAVTDQLERLGAICRNAGATELEPFPDGDDQARRLTNLLNNRNTIVRAGTILTELPTSATKLEKIASDLGLDYTLQARAGTGTLYLGVNLSENKYGEAAQKFRSLRSQVQAGGGSLVIEKSPAGFKSELDAWGEWGSAHIPMRNLKLKLDAQRLLNPGVMDI
jgi:glycolate oxidase FAD binding subunit